MPHKQNKKIIKSINKFNKEAKVVILAGGRGSRLGHLTKIRPKPMIKIGSKPIIWHIMNIYSSFGINNFIICTGFQGKYLKKQLLKYKEIKKWKTNFVYTGLNSLTGGRIKKIKNLVKNDKFFYLTYGDCLCNIDINKQLKFHLQKKKIATLTAVKYKNPKGILSINKKSEVTIIKEKPLEYINGGFFILTNKIFKYLKHELSIFEKDCLYKLSKINELAAFKHNDFWACMDTPRERIELNKLCKLKIVPWKIW